MKKRYGKTNWLNTPLSRKYKIRKAWRDLVHASALSSIAMVGKVRIDKIIQTNADVAWSKGKFMLWLMMGCPTPLAKKKR